MSTDIKSKEEILNGAFAMIIKDAEGKNNSMVSRWGALEAMHEYAKQQAIAFLKYFTGNQSNDLELDYNLFIKSQSE